MSETKTTSSGFPIVATIKGYLAEIYHFAATLFSIASETETEVSAFTASHPEVVAAAATLEQMAPPEVRAGINTAEAVVTAISNISEHTATVAKAAVPLLLICLLGVSGCAALGLVAPTSPAAITTDLTAAKADLQTVVTLYGINKGLAGVALPSLPASVASVIVAAEATGDAQLANAQAVLAGATMTAANVEALVAQLQTQANTLAVQAAGVIKVVPST